jgi:hypothetical protein
MIVFVTNAYVVKASGDGPNGADDNCAFEFNSALLNQSLGVDKMIVVVMEPRMRMITKWPGGAVKGKLGPKLYIDMSDDDDATCSAKALDLYKEVMTAIKGSSAVDAVCRGPAVRDVPLRRHSRRDDGHGFAAFLSHYKIEAATEARWLQENLESMLDERCFLDSEYA